MNSGKKDLIQLLRNMGLPYIFFRIQHEIRLRSGWAKKRFPVNPSVQTYGSLAEWRALPVAFFKPASLLTLPPAEQNLLKNRVDELHKCKVLFFSSQTHVVTDWHTHPLTGFRYESTTHWSEVSDFSPEAGDIKYVWEKARFTFLYDLIRYDHHFKKDQSTFVFKEISSWVSANPINCGPHWRCSQEISLRLLNWTFALHYYRNSPALTPERFSQIMHSMYWQLRHVEDNIQFSRKAVRNNHALTETLTLYLMGMLFPFFPGSAARKIAGKRWFEQEIAYQIYEDGTFLQFSMNYHRVVVQLLSWGISLAHLNHERWEPVVYERAERSLHFLTACQDSFTGWLPNYGNNDGALFFPLTACHFRDFRPQLNALAAALHQTCTAQTELWAEEAQWLGLKPHESTETLPKAGFFTFPKGGYSVFREGPMLLFLRCGSYKDRPFQADNLHLDLWMDGENLLRDAGSYLYNTEEKWTRYFAGTASHNTVMVGDFDQMRKGPRFIWFDWIRESSLSGWLADGDTAVCEEQFTGFRAVGPGIVHRRRVTKKNGVFSWVIEDWLLNAPPTLPMHQRWHPSAVFLEKYSMRAFDKMHKEITANQAEGWYSEKYGKKEPAPQIIFTTSQRYIRTEIRRIP